MLESATRRKRKRSITVEPSCIFDTSPSPSQRAYNLRSSRRDHSARSRSPSCPPIAHIGAAASDEAAEKDDSSIAVEDDDGPLVDELASPKDSDPLTIEAFLQRSSAARTKTYRGRHKRRRVHFTEIDPDYAPPEDNADEAEDQLGESVNNEPDDDQPLVLLASSRPGSSVAAPPRKKRRSLSHRLTMSALECGGTVPVEPEPPTTPPRIPLTFVAANGTTKPPKRPRKTGHLVDPRRRTTFERSISHFRAVAAQKAAAAVSPSRSAATLLSRATAASPSRLAVAAKPKYRPKWRTHAPPILPKAYFSSCAADSILPPPGKKPHRKQPAQVLDTIPLKLVPLKESVVGARTKLATGRPGRRMTRKKDAVLTGPGPLTFVSVLTRNVQTASSSLPVKGRPSSPTPMFCMTSVRDRLLCSGGPYRSTHTDDDLTKARGPEHDNTASPDAIDLESPPHAGSASPFSSKAASNPVFTSTAKTALSSTSKHPPSSSKPAPFSAFKTPLPFTSKTPVCTNSKTSLRSNANTTLTFHVNATHPSTAQTTLPSSTKAHPSSTKPLKPLAAFHDRLAETEREDEYGFCAKCEDEYGFYAKCEDDCGTKVGCRSVKCTERDVPTKQRRYVLYAPQDVLFPTGQDSLVPASDNVYAGVVSSWNSSFSFSVHRNSTDLSFRSLTGSPSFSLTDSPSFSLSD